jgi:CDP-diacylglycerol--serine O-phosphatidyltransferase
LSGGALLYLLCLPLGWLSYRRHEQRAELAHAAGSNTASDYSNVTELQRDDRPSRLN